MDTLLDNKGKKLFDEAYQAYLNITRQIEDMYSDGVIDPFADAPSVTDMVCSLDKYLQGCLLKIGVSDGTLSPEELYFISALPDEFDEVCARNRGYKRFMKLITVESFKKDSGKYYDFDNPPMFLTTLTEDFDEAPIMVRSNLQIIFNAFIAIDGAFSECEADIALELLDRISADTKEDIPEDLKEERVDDKHTVSQPVFLNNDLYSKSNIKSEVDKKGDDLEIALNELNDLIGLENVKHEVSPPPTRFILSASRDRRVP